MNKMSVRPTHDDMATGHTISGAGLLTPLGVDTIVAMYPGVVVPLLLLLLWYSFCLACVGVSIYLVGFLW